jgi:hypothetical protein
MRHALLEESYVSFFEHGTIEPALAAERLRCSHAQRATGTAWPMWGACRPRRIGRMNLTRVTMMCATVLLASSAWAQGVYVGGAVAAEVVRTTSTKSGGTTYDNGSGEAFGGAIRVGTFITERLGVELEYFRPGEIDSDGGGIVYPVDLVSGNGSYWFNGVVQSGIVQSLPYFSQTMRVRTSTTSALLTARQPLGGRAEIVYLGGVGFSRVVREVEYGYGFSRIAAPVGSTFPRFSERTTQYAAGPVVGVEVRAGMTEHAQLVAGLRLHALGQAVVDGWMLRPSVGLTWKF